VEINSKRLVPWEERREEARALLWREREEVPSIPNTIFSVEKSPTKLPDASPAIEKGEDLRALVGKEVVLRPEEERSPCFNASPRKETIALP
jgi:hypothetical protein